MELLAETGEDIGPVVLSQIQITYDEVAARTDAPLVYVKAAITGGGYLVEQVNSAEEALATVRT